MGPLGWPETVFIFFLALILFGPKKLPELGRTVGKSIDRVPARVERIEVHVRSRNEKPGAGDGIDQGSGAQYQSDTYSYDYSSNESHYDGAYGYEGSYGNEIYDSTATNPSTHKRIRTSGR